jgi:hypothetical protein
MFPCPLEHLSTRTNYQFPDLIANGLFFNKLHHPPRPRLPLTAAQRFESAGHIIAVEFVVLRKCVEPETSSGVTGAI